MKIALIHDHLAQDGGAEKVLKVFHDMWPNAPIFVMVHDAEHGPKNIPATNIRTSFIQKLPFGVKKYKWFLPLMPTAFEKFDLSEFDVVLSSVSGLAKGVITKPQTLHISYCHTPTRYLWSDTHEYVSELPYSRITKKIIPFFLTYLRMWDKMAADRVDYFIANSQVVKDRIKKYYNRESVCINPPVEFDKFHISEETGKYFIAGGRLVPYKRFDIIIQAFNRLKISLKIFGDGPEMSKLQKIAKANIEFLGRVSTEELAKLYAESKALIFPQEEDFGIVPLEAMSSGTPVIAWEKGGVLETVVHKKTGYFFEEQSWGSLAKAVVEFQKIPFDKEYIRKHAETFSTPRFEQTIKNFIETKWEEFKKNGNTIRS